MLHQDVMQRADITSGGIPDLWLFTSAGIHQRGDGTTHQGQSLGKSTPYFTLCAL